MNDDYLWDKTGQPDPQIQQLEEILGALRYQPKPLVIPDDVRVPRQRNYFPLLAIAASILLAIVAGGIWLRVRSRNEVPPQQAQVETPTPKLEETAPPSPVNKSAVNPSPVIASNKHRNRSVLPKRDREQALMAKEQLMLALRVTTQKLHLVHTQTQSPMPANQIKNQHRIG